jgi:hypothetical protein
MKKVINVLGFFKKRETGQTLAETAIITVVAVIILAVFVALIPINRARTAATSAALACAESLSQSRDPSRAKLDAEQAALTTLKGGWSGTGTAEYAVNVVPPNGPGGMGTCYVSWRVQLKVLPVSFGWSTESFTSRNEGWRSQWSQ